MYALWTSHNRSSLLLSLLSFAVASSPTSKRPLFLSCDGLLRKRNQFLFFVGFIVGVFVGDDSFFVGVFVGDDSFFVGVFVGDDSFFVMDDKRKVNPFVRDDSFFVGVFVGDDSFFVGVFVGDDSVVMAYLDSVPDTLRSAIDWALRLRRDSSVTC